MIISCTYRTLYLERETEKPEQNMWNNEDKLHQVMKNSYNYMRCYSPRFLLLVCWETVITGN